MIIRKLCFWSLSLLTLSFASCSKDVKQSPEDTHVIQAKDVTPVYLSAEIGFEEEPRAIKFELETVDGKSIPRPQFKDKAEVDVHTIIRGSNGDKEAKTLKWKYDASTKKLVLEQKESPFTSVNLATSGVKWYVSALLAPGTRLEGTQVAFAGKRELRGLKKGETQLGELEVPYALGWTELSIELNKKTGGYHHASLVKGAQSKFKPLGAIITYLIGNKMKAGPYSFTPNGMLVTSNLWGDRGTFELNPSSQPKDGTLPEWKEKPLAVMTYTFAQGHTPKTMQYGSVDEKLYYAWVMPNTNPGEEGDTEIVFTGQSNRPEMDGFKDYTKTYFTDYEPKNDGSKGQVTSGKIHKLTVNVTTHMALPIEYVTDFNLAGSKFAKSGTGAGGTGDLRFATQHTPEQSGYYSWHTTAGVTSDGSFTRNTNSLYDLVPQTFGEGKYFIPSAEHWWGVFISPRFKPLQWGGVKKLSPDLIMLV